MKKTIIFVVVFVLAAPGFPSFAQRDIKSLNGLSDAQIRQVLGNPVDYDAGSGGDACFYYYPAATIVMTADKREVENFNTDCPDYCVLTKFIRGGIKVGDSIEKLNRVDFSKVDYGRNNPQNALTFLPDASGNSCNYVIFQKEAIRVYFKIENGVIKRWRLSTPRDIPYAPYDSSISFW
jgi:hypothetical protein